MPHEAITLKAARANRDLTQQQLAFVCEVTPTTISLIENGQVRPHQSTKDSIEHFLGRPIDWQRTFNQGRIKRQILTN